MPYLKIVKTTLLAMAGSVLWIYRRINWYSLIYRALLFLERLLPNRNSCDFSLWTYRVTIKRSPLTNTQLMIWKKKRCTAQDALISTEILTSLSPNILWYQQVSDRRTHRKHTSRYPLISANIWQEVSSNMFRTVFLCAICLLPWTCVLMHHLPQYYV